MVARIAFDQEFAVRYNGLVDIIDSWVSPYHSLGDMDILDFGCGEAITALGFAQRHNVRSILGVDIGPDVYRCAARAEENVGSGLLPTNLQIKQIQAGEDFSQGSKFDLIYSWSVFEHIDQSIFDSVIRNLRNLLKPKGLLFVQIAPLFYSADGSHLYHRVPEPWAHLTMQSDRYLDRLTNACASLEERDALWGCFATLNRITAPELKRRLDATGLTLLREFYSEDSEKGDPPSDLLEVYQKDVLVTNQVVLLYQNA